MRKSVPRPDHVRCTTLTLVVLASVLQSASVSAQQTGGGTTGGQPTVSTQSAPAQPAPAAPIYGANPSQSPSDKYLPSSSRASSDTSRSSDGFDLAPSGGGSSTVRGAEGATGVLDATPARVPATHTVRRGETLWDIVSGYYRSPWLWPKIWAYNPQIQNPHWIYPGDQIKLRNDGGDDRATQRLGDIVNHRPVVPRDTVFLRDQGYIDDARRDVWGEISGSPEDRMLLSTGNAVYIELNDDHEPKPNQELTIFRPVRGVDKGAVVQILGTVRIEKFDADKKLARAQIVESLDVIERGAFIGPVGRRFDVVPPARNKEDISAHVLVSVSPRVFHVQNQVVFIDKGADDGLVPGNRLFILRRGDPWRSTLKGSGDLSDKTVKPSAELRVDTASVRGTERDKDYPDEVVGELRVLRVREKTATCLVTNSRVEIVEGDLALARKGY